MPRQEPITERQKQTTADGLVHVCVDCLRCQVARRVRKPKCAPTSTRAKASLPGGRRLSQWVMDRWAPCLARPRLPNICAALADGCWCRRRADHQFGVRLGQARSAVDADRLALSPQYGFATSVAGDAIAEAQRAKLALLVRAARDYLPA